MFQLVNRFRTDPQGELQLLIESLDPISSSDPYVNHQMQAWGVDGDTLAEQWEEWTVRLKYQPSRRALVAGYDGTAQPIWTVPIPPYAVTADEVETFQQESIALHGVRPEKPPLYVAMEHSAADPLSAAVFAP